MQIPSYTATRPSFKRWLPTLLGSIALVSVLLAGCANANGLGGQRDPNQVFVFPVTNAMHPLPLWSSDGKQQLEPGLNMDPAFLSDLYSQILDSMLQVQLVSFDQNLNVIPDAAKSWEHSADRLTWTFHLQESLQWADGTPLTSQDFAFGMQHDLDPNLCTADGPLNSPVASERGPCHPDRTNNDNNSPQAQFTYLSYIKGAYEYASGQADSTGKVPTSISGIETPDAKTLIFHLTQPIAFFVNQLATVASMPIERSAFTGQHFGFHYVEHFADATHPSQSGPFVVKQWLDPTKPGVQDPQHSTEIKLIPNPHWWGKALTLKEVDMPLFIDANNFYAQYQNTGANRIDYAVVPAHEYPFSQTLPDFHATRQLTVEYFGMNFFNPPFDNLQVRQAFALALNKQTLVDSVFQGANSPTNHIIPDGIPGANPNLLTPPDNTHGSVSITGNQGAAQALIAQVAAGCQTDYAHDWCPYIVGSGKINTPVSKVGAGKTNCPSYNVGLTSAGATTQNQIVIFVSHNNEDRVSLATGAAQEWANVLCLNTLTSEDAHQPISGGPLFIDLNHVAGKGVAGKESIWTVGYGVDYVDPQDFTTNQFGPATINNSVNFGIKNPNSPNDYAQQHAIEVLMQQADTMPYDTAAEKTARRQAYQNIEQALVDEVAWIPYDQSQTLYRVRSYVMNFQLPANGFLSDQNWANIYIAAHNG